MLATIVRAGVTVGVIDGADAILFFGLRNGVSPLRIFQGIAAGVLGRDAALAGGVSAALLGVLLHFAIALGIAATYAVAARLWPLLSRRPWVCGPLYGLLAYGFMNYVVIPLSAIGGSGPTTWSVGVANGLLIHAFGIGLPVALIIASAERSRRAR